MMQKIWQGRLGGTAEYRLLRDGYFRRGDLSMILEELERDNMGGERWSAVSGHLKDHAMWTALGELMGQVARLSAREGQP